jgi:Flp pilus assembly protein TadG
MSMNHFSALQSRRSRRGTAAVEFALLLPLLCFLFVGTVDFCRIFYYSITVSNCARNGAIFGSIDKTHALDTSGIQTAAKADASNLNLQQLGISSSTDSASNPTTVAVTVTYPFTTITNYPGITRQTNLSRTVRMSVVPSTPTFN